MSGTSSPAQSSQHNAAKSAYSEVAENRGAGSSVSEGQFYKRKRLSEDGIITDIEMSSGSPSSRIKTDARKQNSFRDQAPPARPPKHVTVLLPNGTKLDIPAPSDTDPPSLAKFLLQVECEAEGKAEQLAGKSRKVRWGPHVWVEDNLGHRIDDDAALRRTLLPRRSTIILQDGHCDSKHCNEWNITPEPHMLGRLPQGYNMETALADEVDNALQAVWNVKDRKRLVSVDVQPEKISIFDTGLGMDGRNIFNWGTIGRSTHLDVHKQAIGGNPPYLKPYLGKYGAGGVAAALHLGSMVTVWSKTRESNKVVKLVLEKEELEKRRRLDDPNWQTGGEFRDMTAEEKRKAPGGSFTLVEITKLKRQYSVIREIWKTRRLLADIYFLYIHSEDFGVSNSKLKYPIEFEVNDLNLAEVQDCETAISNQHTCNGTPFVIDLELTGPIEDPSEAGRSRSQNRAVAHAQITCQYFPNVKGKEELDSVREKLAEWGLCNKSFEDMPRVVVRWLGRLLPENGWGPLPFMKVPVKKVPEGWKLHWAKRVRATVAVDAGFQPTQSKTQLERDQPFTVALQYLGDPEETKKSSAADVEVVIKVKGVVIDTKQLIDEYMKWLKLMHENYDEEVEFLDRNPTYIVEQPPFDALGLNKDLTHLAIVFYKHIKDSQGEWNAGDATPLRVKLPRGASGANFDIYATVEWFYCQGTGDEHGEVRMICRPIDVAEDDGSEIKKLKSGRVVFCINRSISIAWTRLKTSKLHRLTNEEWAKKEEELTKKAPAYIEILNEADSKALNCDKTLPTELNAGSNLPQFLAVVRPKKGSGASHKQGMVHPKALEMKLQVVFTERFAPVAKGKGKGGELPAKSGPDKSTGEPVWEGTVKGDHNKNGVKGLYLFDPKALGLENKLVKQGNYHFKFEVVTPGCREVKHLNSKIKVHPSTKTKGWRVCTHTGKCDVEHPTSTPCLVTRLREQLTEELYITKPDIFGNLQTFSRIPTLRVTLETPDGNQFLSGTLFDSKDMALSFDKQHLTLAKKVLFNEGNLGPIAPTHKARLVFHVKDGKETQNLASTKESTAQMLCQVYPGEIATVSVEDSLPLDSGQPLCMKDPLRPNDIIKVLTFQGKDVFGNVVEKGQNLEVQLDGLQFQDKIGPIREVGEGGLLNLGGLLRVTGPYNSRGSISILPPDITRGRKKLLDLSFKVSSCSLHIASPLQRMYLVGSTLQGVLVEVLDSNGVVDTTVDGPYHTLTLDWMNNITCPINKGRCELPSFQLPSMRIMWCGQICHSTHKNVKVNLELRVEHGIACQLALPPDYRVVSTRCDDLAVLKFVALDEHGQAAYLTAEMLENMTVDIEPNDAYGYGDCAVKCDYIIAASGSLTSYEAHVRLGGHAGDYTVLLRYPFSDLQQQRGSTALLTWSIRLDHGPLAKLKYETSMGRMDPMLVPNLSNFPAIHVHLVDAYNNPCPFHDKQVLNLVFEKEGAASGKQPTHRSCQIDKAAGVFAPFKIEAEVGRYRASVSITSLIFPLGWVFPEVPEFALEVTPGNYPSTLRFVAEHGFDVTLLDELQCLPDLSVVVDSADGQALQSAVLPVMSIAVEGAGATGIKWYEGEAAESTEALFVFSGVYVPSKAGNYVLQVALPSHDVPPLVRRLVVRHGPPVQIELSRHQQSGQTGPVLQAKLVDAHGNVCVAQSGLLLNLALAVSDEQEELSRPPAGVQRSCFLVSGATAAVEAGVAAFEEVQLSQGRPGAYILTVSVEADQKPQWGPLQPAELPMMVTSGALAEKLHEDLRSHREEIKTWKDKLAEYRKELAMAEEETQRERDKVEKLLQKKAAATVDLSSSAHDEEILSKEMAQLKRSLQHVMEDMERQAKGRSNVAALAFLEACQGDQFLSPHASGPAAGEGVGVPVTLARVESEDLNRILCEYLGTSSLMLLICKTQAGVNALERRVSRWEVDKSAGLAGVSRYPLTGTFEAIALSDIKPWLGVIEESHPQLLLRMDPPTVRAHGQSRRAAGFLGHAVNLLHLREEHLKLKVAVTSQPRSRFFGLRETLFWHLLNNLHVYDTRESLNAAKEWDLIPGGAVSLDGYILRPNKRQRFGTCNISIPVTLPLVPFEERLASGALLPPAADAFERQRARQRARSRGDAEEHHLQEVQASCARKHQACQVVSQNIAYAETCVREAETRERELCAVAKQQRAADTARRHDRLCFNIL